MKITSMMVLLAGIGLMVSGCASRECCPGEYAEVNAATPPPGAPWYAQPNYHGERVWYRVNHRLWNDGYSFSNDPQNHDSLAPVLGLDPRFPPSPLPYKSIQ